MEGLMKKRFREVWVGGRKPQGEGSFLELLWELELEGESLTEKASL